MKFQLVTRAGRIHGDIPDINAPTTIDGIKKMIAPGVGIPAEDQCILQKYPGPTGYKEMRGEQTLGECGIITPNVQLFVWSSTDPVVMRVRDYEEESRKEAAARWEEGREERERDERDEREREATSRRKREEERLTQVFLEGEYAMELRREEDSKIFWTAWRKKHNLFDPVS
jgi:hypothetical protein